MSGETLTAPVLVEREVVASQPVRIPEPAQRRTGDLAGVVVGGVLLVLNAVLLVVALAVAS